MEEIPSKQSIVNPQTTVAPESTPTKKSKLKFLLPLIVILLLIFILVSVFLINKNNTVTSTTTARPQSNSNTTITKNSTPNITKIYPNKGPIGTLVKIVGIGLTEDYNLVHFGNDNSINSQGFENNVIASTHYYTDYNPSHIEFLIPYTGEDSQDGHICDTAGHCEKISFKDSQPNTYDVYVTNTNGKSNVLKFTVIADPNSGPASSVFSGWKKYVDTIHNFTIDYPDHVNARYYDNGDDDYSLTFSVAENRFASLNLSFLPNPNKLSATEFVKQEAFKKDLPDWTNVKKPIVPLNISGVDAVEVNAIEGGAGQFGSEVFISDEVRIISILSSDSSTDAILTKMMSTFKFGK